MDVSDWLAPEPRPPRRDEPDALQRWARWEAKSPTAADELSQRHKPPRQTHLGWALAAALVLGVAAWGLGDGEPHEPGPQQQAAATPGGDAAASIPNQTEGKSVLVSR